jgi:hypothetical protein
MSNPRGKPWTWLDPARKRVIPRRYVGDWWQAPFWTQLEARQRRVTEK